MVIIDYIEQIPVPRMSGKVKHTLGSIIFTALCGVLSGCESWEDIRSYTKEKQAWLNQFVTFKNGVPSAWSCRRVFTLLSPDHMERFLKSLAKHILNAQAAIPDHIAIEGKTLCGSRGREDFALHSLTAFCHEYGLVISEEAVQERSNDLTAIPLLIESLELKKTTISIAAGGCHKHIAQTIRDNGGNYMLGLKRNHPRLFDAVQTVIKEVGESNVNRLHDAFERKNGRTVRCGVILGLISHFFPKVEAWKDLKRVVAVESIASKDNDPDRNVTATWLYYISNHHHLNEKSPEYIRNHWAIENKLHWVMDVQMNEDDGVIHSKTETEAYHIRDHLEQRLRDCKLELHPEKTRIIYCKDQNRKQKYPNTKFTFLGYEFRRRRANNQTVGTIFLSFLPAASQEAKKSIRGALRNMKLRKRSEMSIESIAQKLNPYLRGWINYYGQYTPSALNPVMHTVNKTLIAWAMHKYKRLKGRKTRAGCFIKSLKEKNPMLFEHWKRGIVGGFA